MKYFTDFMVGYLHEPLDNIKMSDINLAVLNHYTMWLREKPYAINVPAEEFIKQNENRHIKNTSIATYQRAVKAFFRWAYDNEYTTKNLAQRYKLLKSDAAEKLPLYASEVKIIDDGFDMKTISGLRNYSIIHLMLDCGLRSGEVIRLKLKDVMFEKSVIYIDTSKGLKSRYIPLPPALKSNLFKYLTFFRGYGDSSSYQTDYFFRSIKTSEPITSSTITQLFRRIKKRTDISRIHPHLCRHTFATSYILGGGDLESLRIYMGHSDITTTSKYLHLANSYKMFNTDIYKLDTVFFKKFY